MGWYYARNTGMPPTPKHVQMSSIGIGRSGLSNATLDFPWDVLKEVCALQHPTGAPEHPGGDATGVLEEVQIKKDRPSTASESTGNKGRLLMMVREQLDQGTRQIRLLEDHQEVARQQLDLQKQAFDAERDYREKSLVS